HLGYWLNTHGCWVSVPLPPPLFLIPEEEPTAPEGSGRSEYDLGCCHGKMLESQGPRSICFKKSPDLDTATLAPSDLSGQRRACRARWRRARWRAAVCRVPDARMCVCAPR
ncbi:hypothetical protein H1C71_035953, partial [Ictidomys tridecemlineatus]